MSVIPLKHTPNSLRNAWLVTLASLLLFTLWRLQIAASLPLSVDESYYIAWSKTPDFGYWTKPPLIAWAIGLVRSVCGDSAACVRTVPLSTFALSTLLLFALARQLGAKAWTACLVACAFISLPLTAFYGIAATTDSLLLLFWISTMLLLRRALEAGRTIWLLVGLSAGLGLLSKYSMGIFAVSALLCLLHPQWRHWLRSPWPYLAAGAAAVVFAPNLWWNLTHGSPTLTHTAEISQNSGYGLHPAALGAFLSAQFLMAGPILLCAFLFWIRQIMRKMSADEWYLLAFALPFLTVISLQALLSRAHANWAAPTYVAVTLAAVFFLAARHPRWLALSFAGNLAATTALYHFDFLVAQPLQLARSVKTDPYWALRNWPGVIEQVRQAAIADGSAEKFAVASDDRAVLAQLQANLPLPAGAAMGWQRGAKPQNHFDQRFRLPARPDGAVLLVTQAADSEVLQAFPLARSAGQAASSQIPDRPLNFKLWWVGS